VELRRHLLFAFVLASLAATACSPTQPTPKPTASAEPTVTASPLLTAEPSPVALEPTVNCAEGAWTPPPNIGPITLTCENAVAAARAVFGVDPAVTAIEFYRGLWCQPDAPCPAMAVLNGGYVIFRRPTQSDLVVVVKADKDGMVTADKPVPIHGPSRTTPPLAGSALDPLPPQLTSP
jgi:hypothetical protein